MTTVIRERVSNTNRVRTGSLKEEIKKSIQRSQLFKIEYNKNREANTKFEKIKCFTNYVQENETESTKRIQKNIEFQI